MIIARLSMAWQERQVGILTNFYTFFSVNTNLLPPSGMLSTQILPPWDSTASLQNASPKPEPRRRPTCPGTWLKRSNIVSSYSGGIPGPVSRTQIRTSSAISDVEIFILPPRGENFTALSSRLAKMRLT